MLQFIRTLLFLFSVAFFVQCSFFSFMLRYFPSLTRSMQVYDLVQFIHGSTNYTTSYTGSSSFHNTTPLSVFRLTHVFCVGISVHV